MVKQSLQLVSTVSEKSHPHNENSYNATEQREVLLHKSIYQSEGDTGHCYEDGKLSYRWQTNATSWIPPIFSCYMCAYLIATVRLEGQQK